MDGWNPVVDLPEGATAFRQPDERLNGFHLAATDGWRDKATVWDLAYRRQKDEDVGDLTLTHPFRYGHVRVGIHGGVGVSAGDLFSTRRNNWLPNPFNLRVTMDYRRVFPFEGDQSYRISSVLHPDGRYRLFIDGKLIAAAIVKNAELDNPIESAELQPGQASLELELNETIRRTASDIRFGFIPSEEEVIRN